MACSADCASSESDASPGSVVGTGSAAKERRLGRRWKGREISRSPSTAGDVGPLGLTPPRAEHDLLPSLFVDADVLRDHVNAEVAGGGRRRSAARVTGVPGPALSRFNLEANVARWENDFGGGRRWVEGAEVGTLPLRMVMYPPPRSAAAEADGIAKAYVDASMQRVEARAAAAVSRERTRQAHKDGVSVTRRDVDASGGQRAEAIAAERRS